MSGSVTPPPGYQVRRAWPHRDEVVVEAIDADGLVCPGRCTAGRTRICASGTDPRLPGLSEVVSEAGGPSHVVGHRRGRRAVVRDGRRWIKVMRQASLQPAADRHRAIQSAVAGSRVRVPELVSVERRLGAIVVGHLDGVAMLEAADPVAAAGSVRRTMLEWWRLATPLDLPVHDAQAERAVLASWAMAAARHQVIPVELRPAFAAATASADAALATLGPRRAVLSHRDLHDAQILVDGRQVGMLDLDTAARADPALDLGNLLAHVDLAARAGRLDSATSDAVGDVLAGALAGPGDRRAVSVYRAASRARLVAVHAFRPATAAAAFRLLDMNPSSAGGHPSARRR